nr:protein MAK16 homolog [Tanacetum cinerariifolium]
IKRESRREEKAQGAAQLEKNIEKELVERVMKGTYGDIYNYHLDSFNKFIDEYEEETEFEVEKEYVEGYEGEEDDEIEDFPGQEALLDGDDSKILFDVCVLGGVIF